MATTQNEPPTQAVGDQLSDRAKWFLTGLLCLLSLVLIAALAEGAIRIRQTLRYGTAQTVEQSYRFDDKLNLRVPIANLSVGHVRTNSLGFRGPEIAQPKPAHTVRLGFIGASTTWCGEVSSNDAVWTSLVTAEMGRSFQAARFDQVNGGVPGYTLKSSLKNLQYRMAPLQPDVIVIYHAANDLSGEMRNLALAQGLIANTDGPKTSWLAAHSLLWTLAEKQFDIWNAQRTARNGSKRLEMTGVVIGEKFKQDLTELVQAAQQQAKLVAVATFSTQLRSGQAEEQQMTAAASALYYMPFMSPQGLISAYQQYNKVIIEVAQATGALLIGGADDIPGNPQHFADTVHFTDLGSRAMAARVSGALRQDKRFTDLVRQAEQR